ncbi:MAG: glycosyltransferase family 2 protein [Bacteroidetes bacterium]|nr:glycosyltransferase family 2 protein [Bacteroidota bacterium]
MSLKISVITPSLNSVDYIESAIQNVLEQHYDNFEHVVVDGGSSDGTVEILKKYPHVKWVSEPDRGQTHAMNKGFKMSQGDVLVYLNADDYFSPGAFHSVIPCFLQGAKMVVGKIMIEKEVGSSFLNDPRVEHIDILRHWELNAYPYNPVGYFYRREVYEAVNGFNEKNYMQDLEFLIAASHKFKFTKTDFLLGVYRDFETTITQRTQKRRGYWTNKNFSFITKYIDQLPVGTKEQYIKDRKIGYQEQRKIQKWKQYELIQHQISMDKSPNYLRRILYNGQLILNFPEKQKWLLKHLFTK